MRNIIELRLKHQIYLPLEDDEVDSLLGEFINHSENSNVLAKLFFRDNSGLNGKIFCEQAFVFCVE